MTRGPYRRLTAGMTAEQAARWWLAVGVNGYRGTRCCVCGHRVRTERGVCRDCRADRAREWRRAG